MGGYVEDMLNFAMIKAQKFTVNLSNFRLYKVAKFIKETFTMKVEAKGITLNFVMTDKLSLPDLFDREILESSEYQ